MFVVYILQLAIGKVYTRLLLAAIEDVELLYSVANNWITDPERLHCKEETSAFVIN